MKKIILALLFLSALNSALFAQIDKEKAIKPRHELKIADLLYAQSHYYSAIEYYKEVVRQKPENRYAKYWLAMSCLKASDYENALRFFKGFDEHAFGPKEKMKRVEKENLEIYGLANFYYGVAMKHNGMYDEAIEKFNKFKQVYTLEDKEDWSKKADNEIAGAEWALANPNNRKVKVKSLGDLVNSAYEEANPIAIDDTTIYYTSLNENDLVFVDRKKDMPMYHIYQSKKVDGVWQKGKKLPDTFQDEKFGTGNAALSEDGNRMYFCKCFNNEVDEIICNLFLSEKSKNRWSEPVKLNEEINSPKYTTTQPTVRTSGDGMEIVYFVSDREGGVGGMDIWYFIRTARGDFKGPRLLGGGINTTSDELTPFYDNTENLFYFSSNGHPSIGGFDVFVCHEDEDLGWSDPKNVGKPINSTADDIHFVREAGKTSGFIASNREGTTLIKGRYKGDDLFYFEDFKYGLEGFVFKSDENGEAPLEGAMVRLYTTDPEGNDVLVEELANVKDSYFFDLKPDREYKVEVLKTGFNSSFEYVSTMDLPYEDTLNQNLRVDKSAVMLKGSLYDDTDSLLDKKLDNAIISLSVVLDNGKLRNLLTR
ncbi:MAG: tetratricopeptide repeat protein [Bacteroidetes bacterium]|nr:tetratricopeptide repeat protein [Bacteroidota bacterium]